MKTDYVVYKNKYILKMQYDSESTKQCEEIACIQSASTIVEFRGWVLSTEVAATTLRPSPAPTERVLRARR